MIGGLVNRARMIGAYFTGAPRWRIFPQEVVIELTNHCNLACVMCPQKTMTRDKGFMDEGLFRSIIDQAAGRAELVYLYGTGESFLHKELPGYVSYAASKGLTTVLSTNGLPLTERSATAILTSRLDHLIIAMDGASKETYESIRIGGDFGRLVANIRMLLTKRAELNSRTRIELQMIVSDRTQPEIEAFRHQFTPEERRQIGSFRLKPLFKTYSASDTSQHHTRPCYWLWNMMAVAWNGRLQLCCMDFDATVLPGNARETSLEDLWNSAELNALRARLKQLDYTGLPLCEGCDIPEQGYFSTASILASAFVDAGTVRRLIPWFERLVLLRSRK